MATIQARIEAYIGSITSPTTALEDVMGSERAFIIRNAPVGLIAGYATESVVTAPSIALSPDYRLFSVFNRDSETYATQTRPSSKLRDPDSLLYVTSESPKYAVEMDGNTLTALYPETDEFAVRYAIYDIPVSISGTSFTNIPPDAEEVIIYTACISELSYRLSSSVYSLASAFYDVTGLSVPTSPIANLPAAPLLSFNVVTPTSVGGTSIAAVTPPTPPPSPIFTYTDAVASAISGINISAITSLANTLSVPSAPVFSYTDVISSTYSEADAALNEISTIVQDLASSSISLPVLGISYADFNTAMANDDMEVAQSHLDKIKAEISEYQAEVQAVINEFSTLNSRRYDSSINHAISQVDAYLERLKDISSRADTVALQNEARELERQVSEYRSDLDRYTQDLSKYQSDVQKLVQATQIELEQIRANAQLETDVSVQNEARTLEAQISEYQSSLNLYQAELNEHQIEVQKATAQAQLTQERLVETAQRTDNLEIQNEARRLEKEVSEYRLELERFGTEIQTYGQELQSYGLKLQSKVSEANDKMQRKTLEIQENQNQLAVFQGLYQQQLQKLGFVAQTQSNQ